MHGQSRDQGSDASSGSRTEPAFFQTPPRARGRKRPSKSKESQPVLGGEAIRKPGIPPVGAMLLAVYETDREYRAGILLVESVKEISASGHGSSKNACVDRVTEQPKSWLGKVAELQFEKKHQPGEPLQWGDAIDLASDRILYSEVLVCELKSDHLAACNRLLTRLRNIAQMLEMSRGG